MDEDFADEVAGALTAHGFILENLYALVLAKADDPVAECKSAAKELRRQFTQLPAHSAASIDPDESKRVTAAGARRLDRFWIGVERRLRSVRG